jgi:hypothetical protein
MDIDFVLTWVDGNDPKWLTKKAQYRGTQAQNLASHYRDWDILRYWFRGVECYVPWINKVFMITDNQCPAWLNTMHPKLQLVDHADYIPQEHLPTFNSNCIEAHMHRIEELSEQFVSFNDDMFVTQPVTPEYYFRNGMPCLGTFEHVFEGRAYSPIDGWGISVTDFMNTQVLNAHFNRDQVAKANKQGWYGSYLGPKYRLQSYLIKWFRRTEFQHLYTPHNEKAFLKSVFQEVWDAEPTMMERTCTRFREITNLNIYLMRYWLLATNRFAPSNMDGKQVIPVCEQNMDKIRTAMFNPKVKSLCLNDSTFCTDTYFPKAKQQLIQWFEEKLPQKSTFEK